MTTPNEELRKLAEALQDLLAFHNGPVGGKRPDIFYKIMRRIEEANPAKVIELPDRIDRLEAENATLSNKLALAEEGGKELSRNYIARGERLEAVMAENEAKDGLLKQAMKATGVVVQWDMSCGNAHHPFCNYQPTENIVQKGGTHCNCGIVDCTVANKAITQHLKGTP